jgi:ribonuclease HI
MQRYKEYMSADKASRVVTERPHTMTWIGWKPPGEGWVKINTDRACKGKVTMGCGGIIRDKRGVWLGGFAKHIGICSALTEELWDVFEGLRFTWRMGYRVVELDVDSSAVVKVIKDGATSSAMRVSLLKSIKRLLEFD